MIYKYSKKIYTLLIAILTYIVATAAPARQIIASITQPDGTSLSIRLAGNEFCHYTETTDGVMVTTDSNGVWRYATQLKDGAIRPSIHLAHNSENRNQTELRFLSGIDQKHLRSSVIHHQEPQTIHYPKPDPHYISRVYIQHQPSLQKAKLMDWYFWLISPIVHFH